MISFIVIGRNEGEKLIRCIKSIKSLIIKNDIPSYEIIYVDSQSDDGSIENVAKIGDVSVYVLQGQYNAAIARNVGYRESKGESLFFIDGDMELLSDFFFSIFDKSYHLLYDFVSGDMLNYFYNDNGQFIGKSYYFKTQLKNDRYTSIVGGLFCVKRSIWEMAGGMRTKYRRSQDLDLGLRLAKKGIRLVRKKETFIIHHTIDYAEKKRLLKILADGDFLYRGVLYRDHIFNKYVYSIILRWDYSFLLLLACSGIAALVGSFLPILPYIACILIRALFRSAGKTKSIIREFGLITINDFQLLMSILFFFPKNKQCLFRQFQ